MPLPVQTFPNITALRTFVNTYITPNGVNAITGTEDNSAMNGFIDFILKSMVNYSFVNIISSGGIVVLPAPMNIITVLPTSVQWNDNFQNEYYIVNALGVNIPLAATYSYVDAYGTTQIVIPARTAIHIAKATNGTWIQMNNVGGGSSGGLPPQTGHQGEFLSTDGATALWGDMQISITSADFESDGVTYIGDGRIGITNKVSIFWSDLPNYIYESNGDWQYRSFGVLPGVRILNPAFNANTNPNYHLELSLKGINS